MEKLTLHATLRDASEKMDDIRAESRIPAVIYGGKRKEATSLTLERSETLKVLKKARSSSIVTVDVKGDEFSALIGEIQYHPVTEEVLHIDFRQVETGVPVKTWIDLNFVGESHAVKTLGGMMMINRQRVHVLAAPEKLVNVIEVDLSVIADFETSIKISDLTLPDGVELADEATASVVAVQKPKTKEQLAAEVAAEEEADAAAAAPAEGEEAAAPAEVEEGAKAEDKKEEDAK